MSIDKLTDIGLEAAKPPTENFFSAEEFFLFWKTACLIGLTECQENKEIFFCRCNLHL